jgi:hypothetical protein
MFRGKYQFVEVDVETDVQPHHGVARWVHTRALDERTAANPDTVVGVIVDLDNGIDRILVVGDDAYEMGKMPLAASETPPHPWYGSEGYGRYYTTLKPAGTAQVIMDLLDLKEK